MQKVKDALGEQDLAALKTATVGAGNGVERDGPARLRQDRPASPEREPGPTPETPKKDGGDDVMDAEYEVKK